MPSPTVVRASVRDIITAVRNRLTTSLGWGTQLVKPSAREEVPNFPGDRYLLLMPGDAGPKTEWQYGAGRIATVVRRPLAVIVRVRLSQDPSDTDEQALLDPTNGILALEEQAVNYLEDFFPQDSVGNNLTIEPLHWIPSPRPVKDPVDPAWGQSAVWFSLLYALNLDQSWQ